MNSQENEKLLVSESQPSTGLGILGKDGTTQEKDCDTSSNAVPEVPKTPPPSEVEYSATLLKSTTLAIEKSTKNSNSSITQELFRKEQFESASSLEELQNTRQICNDNAETPGNTNGSKGATAAPLQCSSSGVINRSSKLMSSNVGAILNSVYDDSFMGRADIFRPMLTDEERKMLGISNIPMFPNGPHSICCNNMDFETHSVCSESRPSPKHGGGGDADWSKPKDTLKNISEVTENESAPSTASSNELKSKKNGNQKHVCFLVCSDQVKEKENLDSPRSPRSPPTLSKPIFRLSKSRKIEMAGAGSGANTEIATTSNDTQKDSHFFSKTDTFTRYVRSLTVQSLKSKKLETKLQQEMRVAFFDLEAQRASEDWKFRKSIEALDLEYRKKLLNLVESHNSFQKKLQDRFLKQISKTERRLKKEALQGRLNEGNCFNVSRSINKFVTKV